MNSQNLIPFNKRSKSEARTLGKKGGIASGKARQKNIAIKERLKIALEILIKYIIPIFLLQIQ